MIAKLEEQMGEPSHKKDRRPYNDGNSLEEDHPGYDQSDISTSYRKFVAKRRKLAQVTDKPSKCGIVYLFNNTVVCIINGCIHIYYKLDDCRF